MSGTKFHKILAGHTQCHAKRWKNCPAETTLGSLQSHPVRLPVFRVFGASSRSSWRKTPKFDARDPFNDLREPSQKQLVLRMDKLENRAAQGAKDAQEPLDKLPRVREGQIAHEEQRQHRSLKERPVTNSRMVQHLQRHLLLLPSHPCLLPKSPNNSRPPALEGSAAARSTAALRGPPPARRPGAAAADSRKT